MVVFFHEMAHTTESFYDNIDAREYTGADNLYGTGHGPANYERTAVGLPIDHDGDPSTPNIRDPKHPYGQTENALREELGVDQRPAY